MRNFTIFLFVCSIFLSCSYKGIEMTGIGIPRTKSLKGTKATVEIDIFVNNPTTHNVYLKKASFDVLRSGYTFAKVEIKEPIKIPKLSEGKYTLIAKVNIIDIMYFVAQGKRLFGEDDMSQFSLNGHIKAGTRLFSKKITFNDVKFSEINNYY